MPKFHFFNDSPLECATSTLRQIYFPSAGSAWAYQLPGALGSVRQLADSGGQVTLSQGYDPFGNLVEQAGGGSSGFGYTGEQEDASTGLVYLRARYYNPVTRRFLSKSVPRK